MSDQHLSDTRFIDFELPRELLQGIEETGFSRCTPIQAETLPIALAGKDVAGQAQTGTGKTAAFLIALYHRLLTQPPSEQRRPNQVRALVLAPTRELAIQIHKDAEELGRYTGFKLGLAYGGTGYEQQRKTLEEGVDVLIGTPGRIIDYFKQHVFDLHALQVMVLDEADRMFDLGFIKDIRYLLRRLPAPDKRLNMLFSATLSHRVMELAYEHMNEPELVRIEPDKVTADRVRQAIFFPSNEEKTRLLVGLIREMGAARIMVFVNMKREAERVEAYLEANGIHAKAISGDVPQKKRLRMLMQFQSGELPVLIGTDVASRGLHIPEVSHVFNFDLPQLAEDYVHRIGRTARAGASGHAISFACEDSAHFLPEIEEYIGHSITNQPVSSELLVKPAPPAKIERNRPPQHRSDRQGQQRGGRPRRPYNKKPGATSSSNG